MSDKPVRRVLLVRHPETVANTQGMHVARGDSPYSELGRRQAAALPARLAAWRPERIVTSPQRRALTPARGGSAAAGVGLRIDPGLCEYDVGRAEGMSHEAAVAAGIVNGYDVSDPDHRPFVGAETVGDFAARCDAAWARAVAVPDSRLLLVTHRGVIRYLVVKALGLPLDALWKLSIGPADGVQLALLGEHAVLESVGSLPLASDDGTMQLDPRGDAEGAWARSRDELGRPDQE